MKKYILSLIFVATFSFAEDVTSEFVRIKDGVVESPFAREVISNIVTFVAYQEADSWTNYALSEASNIVGRAVGEVAQYRNEQEGVGYINYYLTTFGNGGVVATDTNATVKAVRIDVDDDFIQLWYDFEDEVATTTNRIEFTKSIGKNSDWRDVEILESYETNIVVNGSTKLTHYFKLGVESDSGFFRLVAQIKSVDIGDSFLARNAIVVDNKRGLTFTVNAETDVPGVTNVVVVKDGIWFGGTINKARLLRDDTAHEIEEFGLSAAPAKMMRDRTFSKMETVDPSKIRSYVDVKYELEASHE